MQVRLLGPIEIRGVGTASSLAGPKQRLILALLALDAGVVVPIDRIIETLWEGRQPETARHQVYVHMSRLRRELAAAMPAGTVRQPIETRPPGYVLRLDPGELDLDEFEARYARGRALRADGDPGRARDVLVEALALWRGPVLGDAAERLPGATSRLNARRSNVLDERIEADLQLGRIEDLVPELRSLVSADPLQERLLGQLIRALYRAGRPAEALAAYAAGRERIVEELGVEPGPALRELHAAVLRNDPALDSAEPAAPELDRLPPDCPDFTGREDEVERLVDILGTDLGRPRVCSISGRPGTGKTTLAIRAAHRLRGTCVEQVLYIDLTGTDSRPVEPRSALADLLAALGVRRAELPDSVTARAALFRARVSDRRVLVVLDNAADERQVMPLLPDRGRCAVLITSRSRLGEVVDNSGAIRFDLDVLDEERAVRLVGRIIGVERVMSDPDATARLVRLCGRLPLALRIAGTRLARRPDWAVARLVDLLADERGRLDELRTADLEVRAGLTSVYRAMGVRQRQLFDLLGLLDTTDFASWVAAALLDTDVPDAERVLEDLVRSHVLHTGIDECGNVRYRFHDLVHLLARERAQIVRPKDRIPPLRRLLGAWLALAERADRRLTGGFFRDRRVEPPWMYGSSSADKLLADPMDWLRSECAGMVGAIRVAVENGQAELACDLAGVLVTYFCLDERFEEWRETHEAALRCVRLAESRRGEAIALRGLAELLILTDHNEPAVEYLERATDLFDELGDRYGWALTLARLGTVHRVCSRNVEAADCLDRAVEVFTALGYEQAESYVRHHRGVLHMELGESAEARTCYERSLDLARTSGFGFGQAPPLRGLGLLALRRDDLAGAETYLTAARGVARGVGDGFAETLATTLLAEVYIGRGRYDEAVGLLEPGFVVFRRSGDRFNEAYASRLLGEAHRRAGDPQVALPILEHAVTLWEEQDTPLWQARGSVSVGDALRDLGDLDGARAAWRWAWETFRRLGAPDVDAVTDRLRPAFDEN